MGAKSDALQAELDAFRAQVRAEAIRIAKEEGWCNGGLNQSLRRLGLPEKRDFTVSVTLARPQHFAVTVSDAESRADAIRRLHADPELALTVARSAYGDSITREMITLPELPAGETAPAGVSPANARIPRPGDECPTEGDWYRAARNSGDPERLQCRELAASSDYYYCTRPHGHAVSADSPHVAAGRNEGVRFVWTEGGTPRSEWMESDSESDDTPRVGDPTPDIGIWHARRSADWCNRGHREGYVCSRPFGHPGDVHIASGPGGVWAVWRVGDVNDRG